jgi:hypothetical protein
MSDNVIKFQKPKQPKQPKQRKPLSPGLRKVLIVAGICAFFVLAWVYFTYLG